MTKMSESDIDSSYMRFPPPTCPVRRNTPAAAVPGRPPRGRLSASLQTRDLISVIDQQFAGTRPGGFVFRMVGPVAQRQYVAVRPL